MNATQTKSERKAQRKVCPECGRPINRYAYKITPGLCEGLIKFRQMVYDTGVNEVSPAEMDRRPDLRLTYSQRTGIAKLRFHGLIAKLRKDGKWKPGYWVLTKRGAAFLRGRIDIPIRVFTENNEVVDHSSEHVTIEQVMGSQPHYEGYLDIEKEPVPPAEQRQAALL